MTEPELRRWFGLRDDDARQVTPAVIEGMRDVPAPATDAEQLAAVRVFLALRQRPMTEAQATTSEPDHTASVHDSPHYANGPHIGAPDPVDVVCVCRCAACCGHRPGASPARGEPGRCPACTCYLA